MKKLIILTTLLSACGSDSKSTPSDCSSSNLSNKVVTIEGVSTHFQANCTYSVPACNEIGTWNPTSSTSVTINPTTTSCGSTDSVKCSYAIVNEEIAFSCK